MVYEYKSIYQYKLDFLRIGDSLFLYNGLLSRRGYDSGSVEPRRNLLGNLGLSGCKAPVSASPTLLFINYAFLFWIPLLWHLSCFILNLVRWMSYFSYLDFMMPEFRANERMNFLFFIVCYTVHYTYYKFRYLVTESVKQIINI